MIVTIQERHINNFDFLRFFAAVCVIIVHTYAIIGMNSQNPTLCEIDFSQIGLYTFFIISGFLITKSWDSKPEIRTFLWKRFLRIVPGLVGASFFCVFAVGILNTNMSLLEYLSSSQTYIYLVVASIAPFWLQLEGNVADTLPGVFTNVPLRELVNGPLYTLFYEWACYLIIAGLGIAFAKYRKKVLVILVPMLFILYCLVTKNVGFTEINAVLSERPYIFMIRFAYLFLFGALMYDYKDKLNFSLPLLGIGATILFIGLIAGFGFLAFLLTFPLIIITFAHLPIPVLSTWGKHGDFSYGIYIYAWPVQQMIVSYWRTIDPITHIVLTLGIVTPLAYISWHLIEKRALKLKNIDCNDILEESRNVSCSVK